MISFILKVVSLPLILMLAMFLFDSVHFGSMWQPLILGAILACVGVAMEYLLLKERTFLLSLILDFVVSVILIWSIANMLDEAAVTLWGAILTSLIIGIAEYFIHSYLLSSGKIEKSPAQLSRGIRDHSLVFFRKKHRRLPVNIILVKRKNSYSSCISLFP